MYDKREPYQISKKALSFTFSPNKFEVWSSGKQIDGGSIVGEIRCRPSILTQSQSEVKLFDLPEQLNIRSTLIFDMTFTSGDRIYLTTVPRKTNIDNNDSFLAFKSYVPFGFQIYTREKGDFDPNEPYVCSLFTINNIIAKISFSFGNNPRLIEFYNDNNIPNSNNQKAGLKMAYKLVEMLIEEWDDGDSRISESNFIDIIKSEFPDVNSNKDTIQELIVFINSIFPTHEIIIRFESEFMMRRSWVIMTKYRKADLQSILNKIEEIM